MNMRMCGILAALCLCLSFASARADDLTIGQCRAIYGALVGLDHYKLGAARMTIALDIAALTPIWQASEKARIGMIAEIAGGKDIQPGTPEYAAFVQRFDADLGKPCGLTLGHVKIADLKLGDGPDENAIPPTSLAAMVPIEDR